MGERAVAARRGPGCRDRGGRYCPDHRGGPRAVPSREPSAAGPVLRVLTANLLAGRAAAEAVAELVCRKHADVLFVQELTDGAAARLQRAGLGDLLPHRVTQPVRHGAGDGIYARYPLRGGPFAAPASAARCTARLYLPSGQFVQLAGIGLVAAAASLGSGRHGPAAESAVRAAGAGRGSAHPRRRLQRHPRSRAVPPASAPRLRGRRQPGRPRAVPYLGDHNPAGRPALLAIDHVLVDRRCAVVTASAHRLTGSDHRALYAEIRLPAPLAGGTGHR